MRCLRRQQIVAVAASASIALALAAGTATAAGIPSSDPPPSQSSDEPSDPPETTPPPTITPTPTPTPTTPTPTRPPTNPPTQPPTTPPSQPPTTPPTTPPSQPPTAPPSAPPTAPPTAPPPPPPGQPLPPLPTDPDEIYQQALEGAQTVAVAEAQRLLAQVRADLSSARLALAEATAAAEQARLADQNAQQQLSIAQEAAARTQRQIDELVARTEDTRTRLGIVAREAYQGDSLATLGVVFAAETPAELTDRYVGLRTLLRNGDSALGQMAVDEAELRNAHARLEGQHQRRQASAQTASLSRAAKEAAEQAALSARESLDHTSGLVTAALRAAEDAKLEDYQRYMALLSESTAVGERLSAIQYGPGYGTGMFVRPGVGQVTSEYGPRLHPILGYVKVHTGIDFGRGDGRIYAADSGTVVEAGWNNAYGYMVIVDHGMYNGQRLTTMYAHQADLIVTPGQRVAKGQVIGNIGSTGYSTGPHLHFEVRLNGQHTNPWPWIMSAPNPNTAPPAVTG